MAEKKVRVAVYARVSRPEQILDNQFLVLRDEAEKHADWVIVSEYSDKASGANQSRPGLDQMMAAARDGRIDLIIATKLDRIARSTLNLAKLCDELDRLGVGLFFVEQGIDTTTPEGRMVRTMLGAIAEFELELIHSRTRDGQERARREGKKIGRPKNELSSYQIEKARAIIAKDPDISQRKLAEQFDGIGRKQLIAGLISAGVIKKK